METWLLVHIPTFVLGIIVVGFAVVVGAVGPIAVRRRFPLLDLEANNEVGGFLLSVLGVSYGVLLVFVISAVWGGVEQAATAVQGEATQLSDLLRLAEAFPQPLRGRLQDTVRAYARTVVRDEWALLPFGKESPRARAALNTLWRTYTAVDPRTPREQAVYAQALSALASVSDSRTVRLYEAGDTVPAVLWILLLLSGAAIVGFAHLFGVKSLRAQMLMTASLAGITGMMLFAILALDLPFSGRLQLVSATPFEQVANAPY